MPLVCAFRLGDMHMSNEELHAGVETPTPPPRLLHRVRDAIRVRRYSPRTERAYVYWIRRYIVFHDKRHPQDMGAPEVTAFLTHLATRENVAAATQSQALAAVLFLYKAVLEIDLPWLDGVVRACRPRRLPTYLEKHELLRLFEQMEGEHALMARFMYGTGLRIGECVSIRVKDLNLDRRELIVRDGKGAKDRITLIPASLVEPLESALERSRRVYEQDRKRNVAGVALPFALDRKYPSAGTSWPWFWLFPMENLSVDPETSVLRRWHVYDQSLARAIARAARRAKLSKVVTSHTLRHSFATHLLAEGYDIRTIQELLGHKDVNTTMIYTHVLNRGGRGVVSPLDRDPDSPPLPRGKRREGS